MISRVILFAVLLGVVCGQITVTVTGSASSENVVNKGTAIADAKAIIESACETGELAVNANAVAQKVVTAAAKAVAQGGIYIVSESVNGTGSGSVSASATSTAQAIAEAIATAIAEIAGSPSVSAQVLSATSSLATAVAEVSQTAEISGEGAVLLAGAATAQVFVSAVANALAEAAAKCDGTTGTVEAQAESNATVLASFVPFTSTLTFSAADMLSDGFAFGSNNATATTDGGDLLPATGPAPADQVTPAVSLFPDIFQSLNIDPCIIIPC